MSSLLFLRCGEGFLSYWETYQKFKYHYQHFPLSNTFYSSSSASMLFYFFSICMHKLKKFICVDGPLHNSALRLCYCQLESCAGQVGTSTEPKNSIWNQPIKKISSTKTRQNNLRLSATQLNIKMKGK